MPFTSRKPGYVTTSTRVYAPAHVIQWWRSLDNDERGEALKTLLELKPELISAITWKRAD